MIRFFCRLSPLFVFTFYYRIPGTKEQDFSDKIAEERSVGKIREAIQRTVVLLGARRPSRTAVRESFAVTLVK